MHQRKILGNQAENLAASYLKQRGLTILSQNLKTKLGEIDILAQDGRTLVVVEVKAKSNFHYGPAVEMITGKKRRKLLLLAREIQVDYKRESVRIDVVTIDQFPDSPKIKHYKGAIDNG
ncbi:MAG: YraN family protein [Patescibacteria group bacterium]